ALRTHFDHRHDQPGVRRMANRLRRRQDDHGTPRPAHPPLRDHRDRQRKLALQEPSIAQTAPPLARRRRVTWGLRSAGPAQLQGGQFWTPTRGHDWMLIDSEAATSDKDYENRLKEIIEAANLPETRKQQLQGMKKEELLREIVDNVGKRGAAGQDLQNVISV